MKKIIFIISAACTFIIELNAQSGCTDPLAVNYDSTATINDGSCNYTSEAVSPVSSLQLPSALIETSGLIEWNGSLYTHNDNTDTNIYQISKTDGQIINTYPLPNTINVDWEEISQDENYIYIGDFGNNAAGNRTDLKIYKINKSSLAGVPQIETIQFSYSDQTDFTPKTPNSTDFDCEAMTITSGSIYLFTKQWLSRKTAVYKILNVPGIQTAQPVTTIDVSGLVTGATSKENLHLTVLSGYSETLSPFVYLIYDYQAEISAVANKRKIEISLPLHQIEGIATSDGLEYFLTNEKFENLPFVSNPQKLHKILLNPYLEDYMTTLSTDLFKSKIPLSVLYPNPTSGEIKIHMLHDTGQKYNIADSSGKILKSGVLDSNPVSVNNFSKGIYFLILSESKQTFKIIKK